ncbi:FAD-dependent oxidoreductase [Streptomyces mirabilis]|uniref:FAD-dependent oxidoreductase n=1 Tax=Streptomyces mirabilis TaxID=68239 RepID=UPI0036A72BCF
MVATRGGPDVLVVSAGLAGLACARDLTRAGLGVRVLEASDGVGGRMRSDRHEGFVIDRGFQAFNTSYPQVRRRLALRALRLRPFTPGVLVHTDDGPLRLSDPTRGPRRLGDLRPGRLAGSRDLAALGVLSARDMLAPARSVKHGDDRTTRTALAAGGFGHHLTQGAGVEESPPHVRPEDGFGQRGAGRGVVVRRHRAVFGHLQPRQQCGCLDSVVRETGHRGVEVNGARGQPWHRSGALGRQAQGAAQHAAPDEVEHPAGRLQIVLQEDSATHPAGWR